MKKYQYVQRSWLKATAAALLPLMTATLPFSVPGWARLGEGLNPNAVNASALKPEAMGCNDFCEALVASVAKGDWDAKNEQKEYVNLKNTSGSDGPWSNIDDKFCANHGYQTNVSVPSETVSPGDPKCHVAMLSTDGSGSAACKKTADAIFRCQMHNSQVIPQCLAYKATKDASDAEMVVAVLDTAAAASCGVACYSNVVTFGSAEMACQAVGAAATVGELLSVKFMGNGPVATAVDGALAAVGGAAVGVNIATARAERTATESADKAMEQATQLQNQADASARKAGDQMAETGTPGDFKEATDLGKESSNAMDKAAEQDHLAKKKQDQQRKAACTAAVSFALLAGLRYGHYGLYHNSQGKQCDAVKSLAASIMTGNTGPAGNQGGGSATGFAGISTPGGVVGGNGSGGSNGSSANGTGTDPGSNLCSGGSGCSVPPNLSAAVDGGLLTQSGLDKLVAKPAADLLDAFQKGLTPAQALQSALGASGGGQGGALAGIAQASQDNPGSLGGKVDMGGGPSGGMYAGGGGGGGGRSGGDANPFGNLFGGAGAGAGARATASEEFGKGRVMDIYHTGTSQNLFEIVSGKVSAVAGRVGAR